MFEDIDSISKEIRKKKRNSMRPDMDSAGQEALDPVDAWEAKQDAEVNDVLGEPDHSPASDEEMGENDSSQEKRSLKKIQARINSYFKELL
jgi:hypothetical protein